MLASTLAIRVPDSGLREVACFHEVTSFLGLVAGFAVGRPCPSGASTTRTTRGGWSEPVPGSLAYSGLYLRVTPTICAQ
jgi:hypothetical protein